MFNISLTNADNNSTIPILNTQISLIINKINNLLHSTNHTTEVLPIIVAIDGMSGSGKTTLGKLLHKTFPESNLFHMDDYFLQPHQKTEERLSQPGGNVDYERFKSEILAHLNNKKGLAYQVYDCRSQTLQPQRFVSWKPLVIIEGAYSQHPYFNDPYTLRIFCEISNAEQRQRILKRNGEFMLKRFQTEWIPKENLYFETFHIKEKADSLL